MTYRPTSPPVPSTVAPTSSTPTSAPPGRPVDPSAVAAVALGSPVADGSADGTPVTAPNCVEVGEGRFTTGPRLSVALGDLDAVAADDEDRGLGLALAEADADAERVLVMRGLGETAAEAFGDELALALVLGPPLGRTDGEGLGELLALADGEGGALSAGLGSGLGDIEASSPPWRTAASALAGTPWNASPVTSSTGASPSAAARARTGTGRRPAGTVRPPELTAGSPRVTRHAHEETDAARSRGRRNDLGL